MARAARFAFEFGAGPSLQFWSLLSLSCLAREGTLHLSLLAFSCRLLLPSLLLLRISSIVVFVKAFSSHLTDLVRGGGLGGGGGGGSD